MLINEIEERMKGAELTQSEFEAVKKLVRECAPGYSISKVQKRSSKIPLGTPQYSDDRIQAVNPLTGYVYGYETGGELVTFAKENGWCGQFAGKVQWETLGRSVKEGQEPILSYLSIYKKPINLYAYEQTE